VTTNRLTSSFNPFWLIALANGVMLFGSAAPSPLYPVYQRLFGFSSATLTIIFAIYVAGLLFSLLTLGSLSDHVGRRPVLIVSMLVLVGSMAVFATAGGTFALIIARLVQGLATGAALGALSAALVDLQPSPRIGAITASVCPIAGIGVGIIVSALLVQYLPDPRRLIYEVTGAALILMILGVGALVPEGSPKLGFESRAHLARTVSPKVSIPEEVRVAFVAGIPALVATWALAGLALSLGSSILAVQLGVTNIFVAGILLGAFFLAAALTAPLALSAVRPVRLPTSYGLLALGLALQLVGLLASSVVAYTAGLVLAGVGFSTAYVGFISSVSQVAPAYRGGLFAAVYTLAYTAFSLPAVAGGFAATEWGLKGTTIGYIIFVFVMVALAAAFLPLRARAARRSTPEVVTEPADSPIAFGVPGPEA
jgi:predicted MFS family arabinose efflux permease